MLPVTRPYLIAETAFHHQGDIKFLKELVDGANEAGADAVKFHLLFDLDDYMIPNHQAYKALEELLICQDEWKSILEYTKEQGLDIICLCNDVKSVRWVNEYFKEEIAAIEIHAVGLNDIFLLEESSKFGNTVILGSGGSSLEEIQYAVDMLSELRKTDVLLMHGFQNYPTNYKDIVLSKMETLHSLFNLPIGYADHTDPEDSNNAIISTLPIVLGFNIIEKHFTCRYGEKRIDSQSAISIEKLKEIKTLMRIIWEARGANPIKMSEAEQKYGDTGPMKKAIVAKRFIPKGKIVDIEDIAFKRTNTSAMLRQLDLSKILNSEALKDVPQDEMLDFSNIEYNFSAVDFSQFFNR